MKLTQSQKKPRVADNWEKETAGIRVQLPRSFWFLTRPKEAFNKQAFPKPLPGSTVIKDSVEANTWVGRNNDMAG